MNAELMEAWGKLLVGTAKAQKNLDSMAGWLRQWQESFGDLTTLWGGAYDFKNMAQSNPFYPVAWKESEEILRKCFKDFLSLWGVTPVEDHLKLIQKYEELKAKNLGLEETIEHLRMLLNHEGIVDYGHFAKQYQDAVKQQTDQYQKVMENLSNLSSLFCGSRQEQRP